jgi:ketosteroid isomerase-like protein
LSLRHRLAVATISFALIGSTHVSTARAQQSSSISDKTQIVETLSGIFTAAGADDVAKFDALIAPGFYMYDAGARFNGDSIMALIKAQHAAGKRYEWNVTEPDVHINGNTAWIAYVNKGSITDASGTQNLKWLESAFLEKQAGTWKIVFLHSTRVPPAPQENKSK